MISFDRRTGNVNLTPIWNEINSIKIDTLSLYTMITAGGGVIPEELLNSITLLNSNTAILSSDITSLNNNTSYFNNELYSLKTDLSSISSNVESMGSDTVSLNMDVVSLYNICSSLSDSISTITGGGGSGGPYYLNVSDVLSQSLNYAYNVSGDILSLPYYDISLYGNMNEWANYTVPTQYSNINISKLVSMNSIVFSGVNASRYESIHLTATHINQCTFNYIEGFNASAFKFDHCLFSYISNYNEEINARYYETCTLTVFYGVDLNGWQFNNCSIGNISNTLRAYFVSSCTFSRCESVEASSIIKCSFTYCSFINGLNIQSCTISDNWYNNVVNGISFSHNSVNAFPMTSGVNLITPNYFAYSAFYENTISHLVGSKNFVGIAFYTNLFENVSLYTAKGYLNISYSGLISNTFIRIREITINTPSSIFKNVFNNISSLKFNIEFNEISPKGNRVSQNTFNVITMLDVKDIAKTCTLHFNDSGNMNFVGVSTMKMDYSYLRFSTSVSKIQPSNIYTIDFYNCDPWIVNNKFYIPDWFSGYDEVKVWISGKPIADYSYSLSTTTLS